MYTLDNIDQLIVYTKGLNLLYVEDNLDARETTLFLLEDFFDNVVVATNGEEGLEKFKEHNIDLIITDINMPKLNGLDMIREIREIDKEILIFVLSAYNESGFFMESIKLGVEGYLLKPIEIDQFLGILNKIVSTLALMQQAKTNLHFLKEYEALTNSSAIVSKADINGNIIFVNEKFCNVTGYTPEELIGKNHNIIKHPEMQKEFFEELWHTIKEKKSIWCGVIKILSKDKKSLYMDATIKPILDADGEIVEYIALRKDVTDIMNPKKQLRDTIKNLENPLVIYIKLEEYSVLEELFDTEIIEKIQEKITKYLQVKVQEVCNFEKIFQLGNGEYAIVQEEKLCLGESREEFFKKLKIFQEKVRNDRIDIGETNYDIAVLISVAYSSQQVLESAMLGIKKLLNSKETFIWANNLAYEKRELAKANIKSITMIDTAIKTKNIISYFQPIINNETQEIEKYESLVRLIDEGGNVLTPYHFLDIAKKSKYYPLITDIILEHSFAALVQTQKEVSINLSAVDIEKEETRSKIFMLLERYKEHSSRIVFELLEDENVKNFELLKEFISDVKKLGVKIAIDDFGSGYSNFERLIHFSPDILKIDGSLVRDIATNEYSLSVVKTIIAFAKEQKIKTVAEFVENEEIFTILKRLGVDYSQGYYFAKPEALQVVTS